MSNIVTADFKTKVRDWVAYDDKIGKASEAIKRVKEIKDDIGTDLVDIMRANRLLKKEIKVSNSRLKCTTRKKITPLTKKFIRECLENYFEDSAMAKEAVDYIYTPEKKIKACLTVLFGDPEGAEEATKYIFEQRVRSVTTVITRKKQRVEIPIDAGPISEEASHALRTPDDSEEYSDEYDNYD